jgi:succinoglycan biosynthesis protein ExoM
MTNPSSDLPFRTSSLQSPGQTKVLRICVCVLTFKRPQRLRNALTSVLAQTLLLDPSFEISILVVDNDATGSAEETAREVLSTTPIPYRYLVEPREGLVQGRNRVLEEAHDHDFLALLDDDEIATPTWLEQLTKSQCKYEADVVTGPVDPLFEAAPPWVIEGNFFSPRSFPTGSRPPFVETNNVLISGALAKLNRFDLRFERTGGEDTYFFGQLDRDGARMVWCEEARVSEIVPPARTTADWLIERERSSANRYTRACVFLKPGVFTIVKRLFRASGSLAVGLFLLLRSMGNKARQIRARQQIGRFWGTLSALVGKSHVYYKKGASLT